MDPLLVRAFVNGIGLWMFLEELPDDIRRGNFLGGLIDIPKA